MEKQEIGRFYATRFDEEVYEFIVNSDAHSVDAVGKNHRAFAMIEKCKIPLENIVNMDKLPKFR